jgi:hypothetical protein
MMKPDYKNPLCVHLRQRDLRPRYSRCHYFLPLPQFARRQDAVEMRDLTAPDVCSGNVWPVLCATVQGARMWLSSMVGDRACGNGGSKGSLLR